MSYLSWDSLENVQFFFFDKIIQILCTLINIHEKIKTNDYNIIEQTKEKIVIMKNSIF